MIFLAKYFCAGILVPKECKEKTGLLDSFSIIKQLIGFQDSEISTEE